MTRMESIMLAVSFGAVIGMLVGNIITLIDMLIENHRHKKRMHDLEQNKKNKD